MIYCNGCSFTEAYNLAGQGWPSALGQLLNQPVVNQAAGGGSNDRIYRTTIEYCNTQHPEYVVIGWTNLVRNELLHAKGTYVRLAPWTLLSEECELTDDLTHIHKFWGQEMCNEYINFRNLVHYILHLQDYFKSKQIKYKFFTAVGISYIQEFLEDSDIAFNLAKKSFHWEKYYSKIDVVSKDSYVKYYELKDLVRRIDLTNWIMPDSTMQRYLLDNNYKFDHTHHPTADGHQQWATIVKQQT
jgi:hypothetical protein